LKPKIGLDLDGTICDTPGAMLRQLKKDGKLDFNITVNDLKHHNMEYDSGLKTGFPHLTKNDITNMFMVPEFWINIEIFPGVASIIRKLHKNYEIHIVTARAWYDGVYEATIDWFDREGIPFDYIHYCRSKNKWKYVKENQIDYFVEDYEIPANLIAPFTKQTYLINRPWNKLIELDKNCIRTDWSNVEEILLGKFYEIY
jgi:uncharacterized HAD superfamily protein